MLTTMLLTAIVMAGAGLIQGLTGFGFAIVAMALLPLFIEDFKVAFSMVALSSMVIPAITFFKTRRGFSLKPSLTLTVGAMLGTMGGVWFLQANLGGPGFIRLFGAVLITFALVDAVLTRTLKIDMPKWMGLPCGMLGGFFGGAFNIGGPPMVLYAYSQPWTKHQIVATLQVAFVFATGIRLVLMGTTGYFDQEVRQLTLVAVLPILVGVHYGVRFLGVLEKDALKMGVFIAVSILGLKYLLFPE